MRACVFVRAVDYGGGVAMMAGSSSGLGGMRWPNFFFFLRRGGGAGKQGVFVRMAVGDGETESGRRV